MKVAHLILAHKNPGQIERMLDALQHPQFDFYIHLDRKSSEAGFEKIYARPGVYKIKNRAAVHWAGWGTIQATLNGFREIPLHNYGYVNVMSGQDFPIKPPEQIYQTICRHKGAEYITCESINKEWKEAAIRVTKYRLVNIRIPGVSIAEELINKVLKRRTFPMGYEVVGRANWFTLTPEAIQYCLQFLGRHPNIARYFWFCWGADEFIFSTILYNSHFRERLRNNFMYVDWTGQSDGHPRMLGVADLDALKQSDKLLARKFDQQKDAQIFDLLEAYIGSKKTLAAGS